RMHLALQGEDFIGGLLHDIGKMILWAQYGAEYEKFYFTSREVGDSIVERELEKYGFDHCDAAASLAAQWNLPVALRDAMWMHHPRNGERVLANAKDPMLAALVRVSNHTSRITADPESTVEATNDEDAWAVLSHAPSPIAPDLRIASIREILEEQAQAPVP